MTVVDSDGTVIGTSIGLIPSGSGRGTRERVLMSLAGEKFLISVTREGFADHSGQSSDESIYFSGPNCTGTPYIQSDQFNTSGFALVQIAAYRDGKAYLRDMIKPLVDASVRSISQYYGPDYCYTWPEASSFGWEALREAKTIDVTQFTAPFSAQQ